jgi:tetratricopeptide (TPR) repeat protein
LEPGILLIRGAFDLLSPDDAVTLDHLSFTIEAPDESHAEPINVIVGEQFVGFDQLCAELCRLMDVEVEDRNPPPFAQASLPLVIESLVLALRLAMETPSSPASDVLVMAGSLAEIVTRAPTLFAGGRSADAVLDIDQWLDGQDNDDRGVDGCFNALEAHRRRLAEFALRFGGLSRERELAWSARQAAMSGDEDRAIELLQKLQTSRPVEAGFDLACLKFREGDFQASSDAVRHALSSLQDSHGGFVDLAFSRDSQPPESSRPWGDVLSCQLSLSLLRGGDYNGAILSARSAAALSPQPEHAWRLEAHALRDWAIDEYERGDSNWRRHLAMHLEILDRVYARDPQRGEIEAALEASEFLEDDKERDRWLFRLATPVAT